jgi:hypothetical protein
MSLDFDLPPVYDPLTKQVNGKIYWADMQRDWMATFVQTIITYLTSGGIFLPQLTTVQRDDLDSPQNGQMIYNTTLGTAQYFKAGVWTSF